MSNIYTCNAISDMVEELLDSGYEYVQLREGSLGYGDAVLLSPEPEKKYNFVIREVFLNPWCSGHTVRRCMKISKKLQDEIDKAIEGLCEEE